MILQNTRCREIFETQIDVMGSNSVLLIDKVVLPNKDASSVSEQFDITMMGSLPAAEHSEFE